MCLVENDVDVEIHNRNIDPNGVCFVVWVLDLWLFWSRRWRSLSRLFLLLEDDGAVIGLRPGIWR